MVEHRNLLGLESKNDRAALFLSVAVGLVLGLVVGYFVYALGRGASGGGSFVYWVEDSVTPHFQGGLQRSGLYWSLGGGAIAAALFYIRVLTRQQR